MIDRELLAAAARAAGVAGVWWDDTCDGWPDPSTHWNPLTDDGDTLRLAVRLGIDVGRRRNLNGLFVVAEAPGPYLFEAEDITGIEDEAVKCAATRRAIVRAAAAMAPKEG